MLDVRLVLEFVTQIDLVQSAVRCCFVNQIRLVRGDTDNLLVCLCPCCQVESNEKLRIFTLEELSEVLKGKLKSVQGVLASYKQQGWIVSIRRNTYCMVDIASKQPVCNKYEIGSHLSPTACISYHTALEFHGLAHQPFNEVFVKSLSRFNSFAFEDIDYTYCRQTKEIIGVMNPKGNPYVRVTDVESTLLDCFDRIDRAGGCIAWNQL